MKFKASAFCILASYYILAASVAIAGNGARLAEACTSCHGLEGRGGGKIPPLAGRPETELLAQMQGYQKNEPATEATIMPRILRAYDDAEIAALATYFSDMKP